MEIRIYLFLVLIPMHISCEIQKNLAESGDYCGLDPIRIKALAGNISSPNYPGSYPNYTSCTWTIISPPKAVLTLTIDDIDLEADANCVPPDCCSNTWLALPKEGGRGTQKFCGRNLIINPVTVSQEYTNIKFFTSKVVKGGKGFFLRFSTEPQMSSVFCAEDEVQCIDGRCVTQDKAYLCKTRISLTPTCEQQGLAPCGLGETDCYNNLTQRCNNMKDCLNGRDELDCSFCPAGEFMCLTGGGCYKKHEHCDRKPDCNDFSDEINCSLKCSEGQVLCKNKGPKGNSVAGTWCFSPESQRCNNKFDCPWGEDEIGCSDCTELVCYDRAQCITQEERCDYVDDCHDRSDELDCPPCVPAPGQFQCKKNGRCLDDRLWCNDADDCGDGSDESGCLKNSVITAAIMGSLICGLLLVVAVGCICRLYGLRLTTTRNNYHLHTGQMHRSSRQSVMHPDEEFFHREPPPSYSVAIAESQQLQRLPPAPGCPRLFPAGPADHHGGRHSRSRSSRRHASGRRRSARSLPRTASPPPVDGAAPGWPRARPPNYTAVAGTAAQTSAVVATTQVEESSTEGHQGPLIVTGDDKNVMVDENQSQPVAAEQSQEGRVVFTTAYSSTTSSSTDSPSRDSLTSSTSINSFGNEDTQLLIA